MPFLHGVQPPSQDGNAQSLDVNEIKEDSEEGHGESNHDDHGLYARPFRGQPCERQGTDRTLRHTTSDSMEFEVDAAEASDAEPEVEGNEDEEFWIRSPFAVGRTKATWADEEVGCAALCHSCCTGSKETHVHCSACVCKFFGAGRLGNMVVLWQTTETNCHDGDNNDSTGNIRAQRPRNVCIVGPYWYITLCMTLPFLCILSVSAAYVRVAHYPWYIGLTWALVNGILFFSLFRVACTDPGVLYRHREPPSRDWVWNDQARTYRPADAKYDPECAVVVEKFDHTCPWTGTAIGKRNMIWFQMFVGSVVVAVIYNIGLLLYL